MKISIPIPNGDEREPAGAVIKHADERPASAAPIFDINSMFSIDDEDKPAVTDEQQVPDEAPGVSPVAPPVSEAAPVVKPEDRLAQTTEALTAAVQALTGRQEAPAPAPTQEAPAPKVWLTPEQIPQAMVQLLTSEDPAERVKGIAVFGNALASMIHAQYQKDAQEQYLPQAQAMVRDHYETQRKVENFRQDMNTNYPVLVNTEAGRTVAQIVIQQVSQARHAQKKSVDWFDPDFKKDFEAKLAELKINAKGVQAPAPAPAPAPVAVARSNGNRPVQPAPENSTQQDHMMGMLDTVFTRRN